MDEAYKFFRSRRILAISVIHVCRGSIDRLSNETGVNGVEQVNTGRQRSPMSSSDPLHGVTLEQLLKELVAAHGWAELGRQVPVRCFLFDPSISSSLKFLRRTPWARTKVEQLYASWKRNEAAQAPASSEESAS